MINENEIPIINDDTIWEVYTYGNVDGTSNDKCLGVFKGNIFNIAMSLAGKETYHLSFREFKPEIITNDFMTPKSNSVKFIIDNKYSHDEMRYACGGKHKDITFSVDRVSHISSENIYSLKLNNKNIEREKLHEAIKKAGLTLEEARGLI
jgi:hypothetical protein